MSSDTRPKQFNSRPLADARYLVAGLRLGGADPEFQAVLEAVHRDGGARPRCLCKAVGPEMYLTRIGGALHLKRMPGQGAEHAWTCQSYEPPVELSGLGQVIGSAIQEDPVDGVTSLKLGFSLTKITRRPPAPADPVEADTAVTSGARLSLRGLLHYLWEEAGFNSWTPAMSGKRSWPVIRKYLLAAIERKQSRGAPLSDALFIPEAWDEGHKEEIAARRRAVFLRVASVRKTPRKLLLLLGEVRLIEPARYGHRLVVKHAPDVDFALDDSLHTALRRRFETEISTWDAQLTGRERTGHLLVFATFSVGLSGRPALEEVVLMWVSRNWIPTEDAFDAELVERLTAGGHRFTRCLRYNLSAATPLACALAPETQPEPTAFYVVRPGVDETYEQILERLTATSGLRSWIWRPGDGPMPDLPPRGRPAAPWSRPENPSPPLSPGFDPFVGVGVEP